MKIKKIVIVEKEPNPFKKGYWDIDLKYIFEYRLTFRECDGSIIGSLRATNCFSKRVTLFGSIGSDLVIATDLFKHHSESTTLDADPFILVEAKAVPLCAELRHQKRRHGCHEEHHHCEPNEVLVTIGLFTIIKLYRIVNLTVESRGFCIPEECEEHCPVNPCEFFDTLAFPMDIFAPPQKPEFLAGITNEIPRKKQKHCCED